MFLIRNSKSIRVSSVQRGRLEEKIAIFLRKERGDMTYRDFARKVGVTPSMLFRFEQQQSSMTLESLQKILAYLRVSLVDVLGEDEVHRKSQRRDIAKLQP